MPVSEEACVSPHPSLLIVVIQQGGELAKTRRKADQKYSYSSFKRGTSQISQ